MSLNFEPQLNSAVDTKSGLTICRPRRLPLEDPSQTEYQYSIYLNDKRLYGIGLNGVDKLIEKIECKEWIFMLDIGSDWEGVFRLKKILNNNDRDFVFLKNLAFGLIAVFEKDINANYDSRYLAVVNVELLQQHGIIAPDHAVRLSNGKIVLAEVFIPVQTDKGDAS